MSLIDEALSANATIANDYDPSRVKPQAPKIAIVTCADPRLTVIEQMLGLAAGDVDMIRNFGTVIDDDAVRSLVLSTRLLGSREIMIINHTDCGMLRFTDSELRTGSARRPGRRRSRRPGSTASPTPRRTPRSRSRRPGHIHGSRRTFRSGGSFLTSTPGGSAKCSRTRGPLLVSKGAAAPARTARGRSGRSWGSSCRRLQTFAVRAGRARPWWPPRGRSPPVPGSPAPAGRGCDRRAEVRGSSRSSAS